MDVHVIALPLPCSLALCALCFGLTQKEKWRAKKVNITILVLVQYLSVGLHGNPYIPWAHSLRSSYLIV